MSTEEGAVVAAHESDGAFRVEGEPPSQDDVPSDVSDAQDFVSAAVVAQSSVGDGTASSAQEEKLAARRAAAAAAIAAVSRAAPGQRDRVVGEAVSSVLQQEQQQQRQQQQDARPRQTTIWQPERDLGQASISQGDYQPPSWAEGFPDPDEVSLDVIKTGAILESIALSADKVHYTFGRHPTCDVILQTPTASRLHAVLQFRGTKAYLVDCGSTHGTYLSRSQCQPLMYHSLPVGAQFRFGQSTRSFILNAPEHWLEPEGPSREARRHAKVAQAQIAAQKQAAEDTMRKALQGDVTWGQGPDAEDNDDDEQHIDWRSKYDAGTLNPRQVKFAESIRSKEFKIQRMQDDAKRIRGKEGDQGELSAGQAAALLGAEKGTEKLQDEVQELEAQLLESLADSARGVRAQSKPKRPRRRDSDSESDDDFYDRTKSKARKASTNASTAVHTVVTLKAKLDSLVAERRDLEEQLNKLKSEGQVKKQGKKRDALDRFMTSVQGEAHADQIHKVQHMLTLTDQQIKQTEDLLDIAGGGRGYT